MSMARKIPKSCKCKIGVIHITYMYSKSRQYYSLQIINTMVLWQLMYFVTSYAVRVVIFSPQ